MNAKLNHVYPEGGTERLLLQTLADDLALPLLHVKTSLELINKQSLPKSAQAHFDKLNLSTSAGLKLVEAYRLALGVGSQQLELEPVAIGVILQDVAHDLTPYAKQYSTALEIDIKPGLRPVLANRSSLIVALNCLGISLIRTQASQQKPRSKHRFVIGAHRSSSQTVSAGMFGSVKGVSAKALATARSLAGQARQPIIAAPSGSAAGVLVADMLCGAMWQPLRAGSHNHLNGLMTDFSISKQLQLV